jgi:hypothetical protein
MLHWQFEQVCCINAGISIIVYCREAYWWYTLDKKRLARVALTLDTPRAFEIFKNIIPFNYVLVKSWF